MKERISKNEYYIGIAKAVAQRSTCLRRRYGSIIVKDDQIISTGYNGSPRGLPNCCDVYVICPRGDVKHNSGDYSDCFSVHAEQNAMLSASRLEMLGSTMYLYGEELVNGVWQPIEGYEPCPICSRMICNSGIEKVVTL